MHMMAMIEIAYQLRGATAYLVASESHVLGDASAEAYSLALAGLKSTTTPVDFARLLARSYADAAAAFNYPYTVSVGDMSKLAALVTATNALADALNKNMSIWTDGWTTGSAPLWPVLRDVQHYDSDGGWSTDSYTGIIPVRIHSEYIDLYDFAARLLAAPLARLVEPEAKALQTAVTAYAIAEHHKNAIRAGSEQKLDQSHGIAVYWPNDKASFYKAENYEFAAGATARSAAARQAAQVGSGWAALLDRYFAAVPPMEPVLQGEKLPPRPFAVDSIVRVFVPTALRNTASSR
jgi:hypothetical protein